MIVRAIKRGASVERLAKALDVDIKVIRARRKILDSVYPEVVELLTDK